MSPVYVKKSDPNTRTTWIDKFIALEPAGGVRDAVHMAGNSRARAVFTSMLGLGPEAGRAAA